MNEIQAIRRIFGQKPARCVTEPLAHDNGVTNRVASANAGVRRYDVRFFDGSVKRLIGKRKSAFIIWNGIRLLSDGDPLLFLLLICRHKVLGYNGSAVREAILYRGFHDSLRNYLPHVFGSAVGCFGIDCFVAMEELSIGAKQYNLLYPALDAVIAFHVRYLGDESCAKRLYLNRYEPADYRKARPVLLRMFDRLSAENTALLGKEKTVIVRRFIEQIHNEFSHVAYRRTLTHNDYSDRNIYADAGRLCIYDWELACYQNPEHDLIELLISVMPEMTDDEVRSALKYYREQMIKHSGVFLSDEEYAMLLRFNTLEFCVNKLSMLRIASRHMKLPYIGQLAANTARMMDILAIC